MELRPIPFVLLIALAVLSGCTGPESDPATDAVARADAAAKAKAREDAASAREAERLADLWTYTDIPVPTGRQRAAMIGSTNDVDTDGSGGHLVRLVFRDHTAWGRSSYLVLQAGDFDCHSGCTVRVTADHGPPKPMAARRPTTDEAIAMFINDWRALWRMATSAKQLTIEFPVKAGGTRTATFDVGGLNPSKMPWDAK